MITTLLANSSLYKNNTPSQWSWNLFKPLFWLGWSTITYNSQVLGKILRQYSFNREQLSRDLDEWNLPSTHFDIRDDHFNAKPGLLAPYGEQQYLYSGPESGYFNAPPLPMVTFDSSHELSIAGGQITLSQLPAYRTQSNTLVVSNGNSKIEITTEQPAAEPLGWGNLPLEREIYDTVPYYMKMSPLQPTPKHFDLVAFDEVVANGMDLSYEQVEQKGRLLQTILWTIIGVIFLMALSTISTLVKMYVFYVINSDFPWAMVMIVAYKLGVISLCAAIYVNYAHMYWQFAINRFSSLYDYWQAIKERPILIFPILSNFDRKE